MTVRSQPWVSAVPSWRHWPEARLRKHLREIHLELKKRESARVQGALDPLAVIDFRHLKLHEKTKTP